MPFRPAASRQGGERESYMCVMQQAAAEKKVGRFVNAERDICFGSCPICRSREGVCNMLVRKQDAVCMMEGGYDETAPTSGKCVCCEGGGVMLRWMGMFVSAGRGAGVGLDALYSSGRVSMTSPVCLRRTCRAGRRL